MGKSESTIVVSGLQPNILLKDLERYFIDKGRIRINKGQPMLHIRQERLIGSEKDIGVAMVTFTTAESARDITDSLNGKTVEGQKLTVQTAEQYFKRCVQEGRIKGKHIPLAEAMTTDNAWDMWFNTLPNVTGERHWYGRRWTPYDNNVTGRKGRRAGRLEGECGDYGHGGSWFGHDVEDKFHWGGQGGRGGKEEVDASSRNYDRGGQGKQERRGVWRSASAAKRGAASGGFICQDREDGGASCDDGRGEGGESDEVFGGQGNKDGYGRRSGKGGGGGGFVGQDGRGGRGGQSGLGGAFCWESEEQGNAGWKISNSGGCERKGGKGGKGGGWWPFGGQPGKDGEDAVGNEGGRGGEGGACVIC